MSSAVDNLLDALVARYTPDDEPESPTLRAGRDMGEVEGKHKLWLGNDAKVERHRGPIAASLQERLAESRLAVRNYQLAASAARLEFQHVDLCTWIASLQASGSQSNRADSAARVLQQQQQHLFGEEVPKCIRVREFEVKLQVSMLTYPEKLLDMHKLKKNYIIRKNYRSTPIECTLVMELQEDHTVFEPKKFTVGQGAALNEARAFNRSMRALHRVSRQEFEALGPDSDGDPMFPKSQPRDLSSLGRHQSLVPRLSRHVKSAVEKLIFCGGATLLGAQYETYVVADMLKVLAQCWHVNVFAKFANLGDPQFNNEAVPMHLRWLAVHINADLAVSGLWTIYSLLQRALKLQLSRKPMTPQEAADWAAEFVPAYEAVYIATRANRLLHMKDVPPVTDLWASQSNEHICWDHWDCSYSTCATRVAIDPALLLTSVGSKLINMSDRSTTRPVANNLLVANAVITGLTKTAKDSVTRTRDFTLGLSVGLDKQLMCIATHSPEAGSSITVVEVSDVVIKDEHAWRVLGTSDSWSADISDEYLGREWAHSEGCSRTDGSTTYSVPHHTLDLAAHVKSGTFHYLDTNISPTAHHGIAADFMHKTMLVATPTGWIIHPCPWWKMRLWGIWKSICKLNTTSVHTILPSIRWLALTPRDPLLLTSQQPFLSSQRVLQPLLSMDSILGTSLAQAITSQLSIQFRENPAVKRQLSLQDHLLHTMSPRGTPLSRHLATDYMLHHIMATSETSTPGAVRPQVPTTLDTGSSMPPPNAAQHVSTQHSTHHQAPCTKPPAGELVDKMLQDANDRTGLATAELHSQSNIPTAASRGQCDPLLSEAAQGASMLASAAQKAADSSSASQLWGQDAGTSDGDSSDDSSDGRCDGIAALITGSHVNSPINPSAADSSHGGEMDESSEDEFPIVALTEWSSTEILQLTGRIYGDDLSMVDKLGLLAGVQQFLIKQRILSVQVQGKFSCWARLYEVGENSGCVTTGRHGLLVYTCDYPLLMDPLCVEHALAFKRRYSFSSASCPAVRLYSRRHGAWHFLENHGVVFQMNETFSRVVAHIGDVVNPELYEIKVQHEAPLHTMLFGAACEQGGRD